MCNTSRLIWSTVCCQGVGHMERLTNCNCQPLVKLLLLVQKGSCAASESLSHKVQGKKKKEKKYTSRQRTDIRMVYNSWVTKASANNKVQQPFGKMMCARTESSALLGFQFATRTCGDSGFGESHSACVCVCVVARVWGCVISPFLMPVSLGGGWNWWRRDGPPFSPAP